jgi:hypothetical protein
MILDFKIFQSHLSSLKPKFDEIWFHVIGKFRPKRFHKINSKKEFRRKLVNIGKTVILILIPDSFFLVFVPFYPAYIMDDLIAV